MSYSDPRPIELTDYHAALVAWLFGDDVPLDVLVVLNRRDRYGERAHRAGYPYRAGQLAWQAREQLRLDLARHLGAAPSRERQQAVRKLAILGHAIDGERLGGAFHLVDGDGFPLAAVDQAAHGVYRQLWARGWDLVWVGLPDRTGYDRLPEQTCAFHTGYGVVGRGGTGRFRPVEPPDAADLATLLDTRTS